MPTATQNAIAILDAVLNTTSTAQQCQRVVAAFGTPEAAVDEVRELIKNRVKLYENIAAKEATQQAVDSGFTPTP